jgi:hypothetical protein
MDEHGDERKEETQDDQEKFAHQTCSLGSCVVVSETYPQRRPQTGRLAAGRA